MSYIESLKKLKADYESKGLYFHAINVQNQIDEIENDKEWLELFSEWLASKDLA